MFLLTRTGSQLLALLGTTPPVQGSPDLHRRVDSLLCWAMAHTQIHRPQSLGSPPVSSSDRAACNVRPYATFWQAMFDLGGSVSFEEFQSVLAHLHSVSDYHSAIEAILNARESGIPLQAPQESTNFGIYWKAHLSVAGSVLQFADEKFTFAPERQEVIRSILQFQMGCEGDDITTALESRPWEDIHEYYSFAGEECPAFIASGQTTVVSFAGNPLVLFKNYALEKGESDYYLDGGTELCTLKIGVPCFHVSRPERLLRVDQKSRTKNGGVRVRLGLGRPINDPNKLLQLWSD